MLAIVRTLDDRSTGWAHVVRFLEFHPERWDLIGALLVVIVCSLMTAAVLVRVRGFWALTCTRFSAGEPVVRRQVPRSVSGDMQRFGRPLHIRRQSARSAVAA